MLFYSLVSYPWSSFTFHLKRKRRYVFPGPFSPGYCPPPSLIHQPRGHWLCSCPAGSSITCTNGTPGFRSDYHQALTTEDEALKQGHMLCWCRARSAFKRKDSSAGLACWRQWSLPVSVRLTTGTCGSIPGWPRATWKD